MQSELGSAKEDIHIKFRERLESGLDSIANTICSLKYEMETIYPLNELKQPKKLNLPIIPSEKISKPALNMLSIKPFIKPHPIRNIHVQLAENELFKENVHSFNYSRELTESCGKNFLN